MNGRMFSPLKRATIYLEEAPATGAIVTPIDWSAGDRAIAQYFWTSTDKDETAWTCSETEVARVINFGMKAMPVAHGTPFGHGTLTVHVDNVPLPISTQMLRHRVLRASGEATDPQYDAVFDWQPNASVKSFRYVEAGKGGRPVFWQPDPRDLRKQVGRPGAYTYEPLSDQEQARVMEIWTRISSDSHEAYLMARDYNLAPEQARFFLVQGAVTRMYATESFRNWFNFLVQRDDPHAQREIVQIAEQIDACLQQIVPITYELWVTHGRRII